MHTGPGRGYPIFHVIDRGETVDVVKQRTGWFLVRAANGKEGWVDRAQMERTLQPDGEQVSFAAATLEDFTNAKWETGALAGDFGGANIVSLYGSYSLNPNVAVEFWGSQILGNFSNGWMASVNVTHETWPDYRISPFFTLGSGVIHTEPKPTIVDGEDRITFDTGSALTATEAHDLFMAGAAQKGRNVVFDDGAGHRLVRVLGQRLKDHLLDRFGQIDTQVLKLLRLLERLL